MHQIAVFGGRAPPGPPGGAYNAPPGLLAGFKVKGCERKRKGRRGEEEKREGVGERERDLAPRKNSGAATEQSIL